MTAEDRVESYWLGYLDSLPAGADPPSRFEPWVFGNTDAMADELGELVRAGIKTATSALVWELEADGEEPAQVAEHGVVLNAAGEPLCIIEVTESEIRPFNDVDGQFASDYGEGERTLEWWREGLWGYYSRVCEDIGREPHEAMPLNCVRFRPVYP